MLVMQVMLVMQSFQKSSFPNTHSMKRSVVLMNLDSIPWQNVQDMLDSVSTSHAFDNTGRNNF